MQASNPPDLAHLRQWIGTTERRVDVVTPRLAEGLAAVLDLPSPLLQPGAVAPLGLHWLLAPAVAPMREIGADGHPARGGFMPPVPLPRRMWAGSRTAFRDALRIGDEVRRTSRVAEVALKEGRRGPLLFVTVDHDYETGRGPALGERQDIVYHALPPALPEPVTGRDAGSPDGADLRTADAVLLFRYSALTFNGHRIHYDRAYAVERESYPGLVVHGPLQATWLLHRAASRRDGLAPSTFAFRGLEPLIEDEPFRLRDEAGAAGGLDLWVETAGGRRTLRATAGW